MFKRFVTTLVITCMFLLPSISFASEESELILKILIKKGIITQEEVDEMRAEVEKERAVVKIEAPKSLEERVASIEKEFSSKVGLEKLASKLKLKGRWAAGFYGSETDGSYSNGSFEVPEAKLQFAFAPDEINNIIMRMNLNNAAFNNLDYFYVDSKLSKFLGLPFEVNSRLGRYKLDFGEETWSNNPVESVLASNSAGNTSGSDEGIQLSGKIGEKYPLGWSASISNGTAGIGSDTTNAKAFTGKLSLNPFNPLYISGSYYNSGSMKLTNSEMSIAGLATRPTGATNWDRQIWEVDLRYDFGKGKISVPAYCDSVAFIRLAYGQFYDDATGAAERDGDYGFAEGTWNLTKKIYVAGRYSIVDLDKDVTASLNGVTANKYQRYSIGGGYRWSENTILKVGYDWNDEKGPGLDDVDNDLVSAIVASQF